MTLENLLLKPRTLEHVKTFWEKSRDEEIERLFPFNRGTLSDAIKLYEESLRPGARSFGKVIDIDGKYIGDVWCYGIDEDDEKQAFVSIVIFDKTFWGKGIGKHALKQFCQLVFEKYAVNKLCAFTYKDNTRSIGTLESAGFKKIEEFEEDGVLSCYFELYNIDLIGFKRLAASDLEYMHKWLNCDFVMEWYGKKKWTFKEIEEKYIPYINNEKPTQGYLILYGVTPIGYIQTYKIHDYPDYAKLVDIDENASGLDVFIGEHDYFHKGLGKYIVSKFIRDIVFTLSDSVSCILGPEPKNKAAIKTYENAGFKYIKTIQADDEPEYIMRITREYFFNEMTQ